MAGRLKQDMPTARRAATLSPCPGSYIGARLPPPPVGFTPAAALRPTTTTTTTKRGTT
ncbi:hypothetical protein [Streptomyces sp. NPDC058614]|uniref:hypothetical protein n=1 Tax=Streptomyces sp. NPDC058614 TaxID=3346557 RepID=UPI00365E42F3